MADQPITAQSTAEKVAYADHHSGAKDAYSALKKDYDQMVKQNPAEAKDYWKNVSEELVKKGVLTDMAVAWADDTSNKQKYSIEGNYYSINLNSVKTGDNVGSTDLDQTFATELSKNAPELQKLSDDVSSSTMTESQAITNRDIGQFLNNNKNASDQTKALMDWAPLIAGDGPISLFQVLDKINDQNGKTDGAISKEDLTKFIGQCSDATASGEHGPIYNQTNLDFVKKLRDNWDNIDKGFLGRDITLDVVANAVKMSNSGSNFDDFRNRFNQKYDAIKNEPDPNVVVRQFTTN